jgi:hypothetical protein
MTVGEATAMLLRTWEVFAQSLANGYEFGLDDWLNDVDARQCLADALLAQQEPIAAVLYERMLAADELVQAATNVHATCLWGSSNAQERGWEAVENWWYFVVPKTHTEEFAADLARVR